MIFIGIALILVAFGLTLVKPPRTKKKQQQRKKIASAVLVLGLGLAAGPTVAEKLPTSGPTTSATTQAQPVSRLAQLDYNQDAEITINNNKPGFAEADLDVAKGAWTHFSDLDHLNRAGAADALLNQSLMPNSPREPLTWNPTGWRNKRIKSGWLYNRSHLIGFQLSGENNNPKNLITGTRELNAPGMLAHETDIANYLKQDPQHFVRYQVTPIFRGNELLARGVAMRAQSVGDNSISFNVYLFNVQSGMTLNYANGSSRVSR